MALPFCSSFCLSYLLLLTCSFAIKGSSAQNFTKTTPSKSNNVIYVLVVGLSGSGKSSTINLMFDTNIAEVGDSTSTTSEIFEYSVTLPNKNETELRVIDTPGMEDTRGLENDARFLATLEKYLKSHSDLRHRPPDVVLIFARYDDNRFYGESAKFVKMLKGISILYNELVSPTQSNLIFVMTHFMGVPEKETKDPEPQKRNIEKAIKEFTLFPSPIRIVLAENKGEEQELEKVDSGFKLPNGEIYPHNLCESVKQIVADSSLVKSQFFTSVCYKNSSNVQLVSKAVLLEIGDSRAGDLLVKLTNANLKTEDTQISQRLSTAYENLPQKANLPKDALQYLQKALHLRLITTIEDLPRTNQEKGKLFRELDRIQHAELLLKAAFQIQAPMLSINPMIRNSYDISTDSLINISPFDIKKSSTLLSPILGRRLPSYISVTTHKDTKFYYEKFSTETEYINSRTFSLGIPKEMMKNLPVEIKPGFNIISRGSCSSLLIEFRVLNLELQTVDLSNEFLTRLEGLPQFDISVPSSIQKWEGFLNKYGTHVATSAYAGGSVEITVEDYPCSSSEDLATYFRTLIQNKGVTQSMADSILNKATLKFRGGDSQFYSENPTIFFAGSKSLHDLWKDSLINDLSVLYSDIKIKPITQFLRSRGNNLLAEKMRKAVEFFLQDELSDEHPLSRNIQLCETEKTNLIASMEKLQLEKSTVEKNSLEMTQQLASTKQTLAEIKIQLANEKGASQILRQDSLDCKSKEAGLKSMVESEQRNSGNLKQTIGQLESRVGTLQNEVLSANGQTNSVQQNLNSCNSCKTCLTSDHGFHHHHHRRRFHGHHHNRRLAHCQSQSLC